MKQKQSLFDQFFDCMGDILTQDFVVMVIAGFVVVLTFIL